MTAPTQPGADDFGSLFAFLPIGAYRTTPAGRQLRANPALVRLNGFIDEAEQLACVNDIGGEWYVQASRRAEFKAALARDGQVIAFESEVFRYKTRERIWISENAHIVRDAAGEVLYYEGTVEEITERVRDREALRQSQAQLRQVVDLVPGMVYRTVFQPDGQRRATFISRGALPLYGMTPEQVLSDNQSLVRLRHPEDHQRIEAGIRRSVERREDWRSEFRVRLHSGQVKWVQVFSAPAPPENGNEVRVGVVIDVTERKLAEQALQKNGELWKRALESSGDGVWDWQIDAGIEHLSPACKALYGFEEHELPDTPDALNSRTHPDDLAEMHRARADHFAGRTARYVNEHRVQCKDGQWKWILSRGIVMARDGQGRPLRMIGTHTDVTARRQAEDMRTARDRAEAADLAKSQFLSRVSHELRTPLNAIMGFSQLLSMEDGLATKHRGWVQQVLNASHHLLGLMNDILDLSSAQTGELPVSLQTVALAPLLAEVADLLGASAQRAGITLLPEPLCTAAPDGAVLQTDGKRLKQVLVNLIANAIKYHHRGSEINWVRVSVVAEPQTWLLSVADNGPGLTQAQCERLFRPFERLGAQSGPVPGTGLGLALSRQLTEAMGGQITVSSQLGQGAVFTVRLPRA